MNTILPYGLQNATSPIVAGGKLAGNRGALGETQSGALFTDILKDAMMNTEELEAVKSEDSYNLAISDMDNLSEMMTNGLRGETALQMMIEIRNKLLDAYTEIMRTNV